MNSVCVLITTFLRDDLLFRCIKSLREYYPGVAVFVGDNGDPGNEKREFCREHNCTLFELEFDLGVGGVRNAAIERIPGEYEYIYICEDDVVFSQQTRLESLLQILKADKSIGIAGGMLKRGNHREQHYEANVWIDGDTKYCQKIRNPEWQEAGGIRYYICDLILNVFLMRRAVWDDIKWDPRFKTALEHADFFLSLQYELKQGKPVKRKSWWKIAYTPDVWAYHKGELGSKRYREYRDRPVGFQLFAKKWGIRYSRSDYNAQNLLDYTKLKNFVYTENDAALEDTSGILSRLGCKWWLMSGTLLGAIRERNFIEGDKDLDFGIAPDQLRLWDKIKRDFLGAGFELYKEWLWGKKKIELTFKRGEVKVDLFFHYRRGSDFWYAAFGPDKMGRWGKHTECVPRVHPARLFENPKEFVFRGVRCFAPNPPEEYLRRHYGKEWRTPDKNWKYWQDNQAIDRSLFKSKRTVFIGDTWDKFGIPHLNLIEDAKKLGTRLVVGVLTDRACERAGIGYTAPIESRHRLISALSVIDEVVKLDDLNPTRALQKADIHPDYIVTTDENEPCPGADFVGVFGGKAVYIPIREDETLAEIPAEGLRKRIAIGIKTFMRERNFFRVIEAIERSFPYPYRLYIADDGDISSQKDYLYMDLKRKGHVITLLPHNAGLSAGRNANISAMNEDYVLIMDDDILIHDPTAIRKMRAVLDSSDDIGLVAGVLRHEGGKHFGNETYSRGIELNFEAGVLYRNPTKRIHHKVGRSFYVMADQVVNFFLARREIFNDVTWDERIKIEYEHMDFFLRLKKTPWKVAVCLGAEATHLSQEGDLEYNRYRRTALQQYFLKKHGISRVVDRWH